MQTIEISGETWVVDDRNNRASIDRWGSVEAAEEALLSCSNCSGCSDCSSCDNCFDCSRCSLRAGCSSCDDCSGCIDCFACFDCFRGKPVDLPVPVIENIHRKVYEAASQPGALEMRDWHTCATTHCRAGWVVHLAGKAGYELEKRTNTSFAAAQIYKASGYQISPVRFYDTDEAALEDMRRLANEFQGEIHA